MARSSRMVQSDWKRERGGTRDGVKGGELGRRFKAMRLRSVKTTSQTTGRPDKRGSGSEGSVLSALGEGAKDRGSIRYPDGAESITVPPHMAPVA